MVFTVATIPKRATALENVTGTERSINSFRKMLNARTGKWCKTSPLHWIGYGCWCGLGNRPVDAMDEFDEACRCHDDCWDMHRNPGEICHGAWGGHLLWYEFDIAGNGEVITHSFL